jgi:hypothetical protein
MAIGLYLTCDGRVMVDYGARRIAITAAQYRANGYKPSFNHLSSGYAPAKRPNRLRTDPVVLDAPVRSDQGLTGRH